MGAGHCYRLPPLTPLPHTHPQLTPLTTPHTTPTHPPSPLNPRSAPRVSAGPVLVDAGVSSQHSHLENDASESAEVDAWRQALTHLGTPNWDVWGVRKDLLPSMVMEMFRSLGLVDAAGPMVSVVRGTSVGSSRRMAGTAAGGAEGESGAGTPVGGAAGAGTRFARPRNHSSGAPARVRGIIGWGGVRVVVG